MPLLIDNRQKLIKLNIRQIRSNLLKVLKYLQCQDHEISVSLVDDKAIQAINLEYLGRDKPTNVISFGMHEGDWEAIQPTVLGDIVISVETACRDALAGDINVDDEILFLFIHGLLHLLGFDHERGEEEEANVMRLKEKEIFEKLRSYTLDRS